MTLWYIVTPISPMFIWRHREVSPVQMSCVTWDGLTIARRVTPFQRDLCYHCPIG